ncbi:MAG: hypothetical protein HOK41_15075 [Nitrospina sp.]|nr:hypothetical protein [Nitrospina sp.]MBT6718769.1 hypothetical protein [Nitrospina sp.]
MDQKSTKKPIKMVLVRRGAITIPSVPTHKLQTYIRKRALLGTDEISGDGNSWIRVDRHYQLRKFFSNESQENTPEKIDLPGDPEFSEGPPNIENNLQKVADLLKDINES